MKTHPQRLTSVQYFLNFFAFPFHFTITKSPDVCELLSPLLFTCIVRIALRANKFVSGNSVEVLYRHLGKPPIEKKNSFVWKTSQTSLTSQSIWHIQQANTPWYICRYWIQSLVVGSIASRYFGSSRRGRRRCL